MRATAKLPEDLWREVYSAAIYLLNRMPRYHLNWHSPYERLHSFASGAEGVINRRPKPRLHHLRVYGCKVYAMTAAAQQKHKKLHKLNPGVFIGYLVGYDSTNIYRI